MLPEAEILAIAPSGLMAVSLDRHWAGRFIWSGTLAQVSMLGGAPREILEDVQWADWGPDGASLAVPAIGEQGRMRFLGAADADHRMALRQQVPHEAGTGE